MDLVQALIIAIVQGLTELFPVSSLGHAVILSKPLGIDQQAPSFLPFLVVLHLGTVAALLLYFWRDWWNLLRAFVGIGPAEERRYQWHLLWMIILATIPAVVIGFALEKTLKVLFGVPVYAAIFLLVNGVLLFAGERLKRRAGEGEIAGMRWWHALVIGLWQATALIPGISRSGATMVGGLLLGLKHRDSAHFSFLIATPIILGAGVLEVPKLMKEGEHIGSTAWLAGLVAGVVAYASVAFLMRYFRRHEFEALDPFAYYCWAVGLGALALLKFM
jgi:undecaprenyl-diphosphatase